MRRYLPAIMLSLLTAASCMAATNNFWRWPGGKIWRTPAGSTVTMELEDPGAASDPYSPIEVYGFDSTNLVGFPGSVIGGTATNKPTMGGGGTWTLIAGSNYSVDFDDSDDYLVGDASSLYDAMSNGFTVCFWCRRDDQDVLEFVVSKANLACNDRDFIIYNGNTGSEIRMLVYENGGTTPYIGRKAANAEPPAGVWRFVSGIYTGGNQCSAVQIYTNCVQVDTGDLQNGIYNTYHHPQAGNLVGIGGDPNGGYLYDGDVDRVGIYGTVLTTNQMQDIMDNTHPTNRIWSY